MRRVGGGIWLCRLGGWVLRGEGWGEGRGGEKEGGVVGRGKGKGAELEEEFFDVRFLVGFGSGSEDVIAEW